MEEEATVTSKGQITIPERIRERLGLEEGEKVHFVLRGKAALMVPKSKEPLKDLKEMRKELRFTDEEIQAMIGESKKAWS